MLVNNDKILPRIYVFSIKALSSYRGGNRPLWTNRWLWYLITFFFFLFSALGTLPYIGNFVHIGGFLFGLLASVALLPRTNYRFNNLAFKKICKWVSLLLLFVALVCTIVAFFMIKDSEFCSWCHYIDCVPYTENFCPSMSTDGILDNNMERWINSFETSP